MLFANPGLQVSAAASLGLAIPSAGPGRAPGDGRLRHQDAQGGAHEAGEACGSAAPEQGADDRGQTVGMEPAAVGIVFDSLTAGADLEAGRADEPSVSPALPTILRALGDRDLRATFHASQAVADKEPLALTMVENAATFS